MATPTDAISRRTALTGLAVLGMTPLAACASQDATPSTGLGSQLHGNTTPNLRPLDTMKGDWPIYAGDLMSRKYSPLDQIALANVAELEIAWIWDAPDNEMLPGLQARIPGFRTDNFKGTPLKIGERLYIRTQLGIVHAMDPGTGQTLWSHDPGGYTGQRPLSYGFTTRGCAYWQDENGRGRILSTTADRRLISIDADTGKRVSEFGGVGGKGEINLDATLRRMPENPWWINYSNQVPVIVGDIVVIGFVVTDTEAGYLPAGDKMGRPIAPPGDIRGFDVRTGELKWTFHTIPAEGEFGVETWEKESWRWVGSTNAWSLMSADPERGLIYVPLTCPTYNYYGGFRHGDNLFSDSIVCLEAATGKRVWHFQTIHHDIFDYDLPSAPVLGDITVDGRVIPAVTQLGKNGFAFVFNRVTGEPLWPIEERPVPQSTLPGEKTSPTQPFPTKPPPFAGQGMADDRVLSLTPELHAKALAMLAPYERGPLYTPLSIKGAVIAPGIGGGANWPGGAFDPETGKLYVTAVNDALIRSMVKEDNFFGYRFRQIGSRVDGLPLVNPPWATITAIDLSKGTIAWQKANGPGPKNHPALARLDLPDLGTQSKSNPMVTATLLFAATGAEARQKSGADRPPERSAALPQDRFSGVRSAPGFDRSRLTALKFHLGAVMRAYDKTTGEIVWRQPIGPSFDDGGAPMTYMWKGRQFLVTPTGGATNTTHLIAFALPVSRRPA
ncbi:MAG: PQQ-binding-like beta-propeller repeat protein [Alphaproteobacteria bacterium]|nr:PQQ-binding-like beta-propeller repeat protein [Alphaproteobacteria bacterium]